MLASHRRDGPDCDDGSGDGDRQQGNQQREVADLVVPDATHEADGAQQRERRKGCEARSATGVKRQRREADERKKAGRHEPVQGVGAEYRRERQTGASEVAQLSQHDRYQPFASERAQHVPQRWDRIVDAEVGLDSVRLVDPADRAESKRPAAGCDAIAHGVERQGQAPRREPDRRRAPAANARARLDRAQIANRGASRIRPLSFWSSANAAAARRWRSARASVSRSRRRVRRGPTGTRTRSRHRPSRTMPTSTAGCC